MTLSTDICIIGDVDPEFAFKTALVSVCMAGDVMTRVHTARVERNEPNEWRDYPTIATECGQGLPAWIHLYYRADGSPLRTVDEYETEEPDEDGVSDTWFIGPACQVKINLDTAYSYNGPHGIGSGGLHARVIRLIFGQMDNLGCTIKWHNEFTGEWFDGLNGLEELDDSGRAARSWFSDSVLPAITKMAQESGSTLAIEA